MISTSQHRVKHTFILDLKSRSLPSTSASCVPRARLRWRCSARVRWKLVRSCASGISCCRLRSAAPPFPCVVSFSLSICTHALVHQHCCRGLPGFALILVALVQHTTAPCCTTTGHVHSTFLVCTTHLCLQQRQSTVPCQNQARLKPYLVALRYTPPFYP